MRLKGLCTPHPMASNAAERIDRCILLILTPAPKNREPA